MLIAYFDASALVSVALQEQSLKALTAWRLDAGPITIAFSDFGRGELASTVSRLIRMGQRSSETMAQALALLDTGTAHWRHTLIEPVDIRRATDHIMRLELALRLPDAIHIAIASRLDAALVTLDNKQHRAALALGIPVAGPLVDS